MTHYEPIADCILPQQFIRFTWLSPGACPVFVAATEREIRVRTLRQTVSLTLISGYVSSVHVRIVHQLLPVPFRSVPFRVL